MTDPRIALIDVDGVVADFSDYLLTTIGSPLRLRDIKKWDIFAAMTTTERDTARHVLKDPDFWLAQPLLPGAQEGIEKIRRAGFKVVWATAPYERCEKWENARRAWVREHFNSHDHDVAVLHYKGLLRADFFIDDKPEYIFAWESTNGSGSYMFDAPHNQEHEWPRMFGWDDVDRVLQEVVR